MDDIISMMREITHSLQLVILCRTQLPLHTCAMEESAKDESCRGVIRVGPDNAALITGYEVVFASWLPVFRSVCRSR